MKKLLVLISMLIVVISLFWYCFGCWTAVAGHSTSSVDRLIQTEAVWIPKTGTKYHSRPTCGNMKNPTRTSRQEAEWHGYEPCKNCYEND